MDADLRYYQTNCFFWQSFTRIEERWGERERERERERESKNSERMYLSNYYF